jgi:hypothetical protein
MFNSDTLANRPAAGIVGRIFIAIDAPYGIYRDTGSAWDQISGASTFSGSLATGQVAFGSATNTIAGTNNLFWDAANLRLGIGTNAPSTTLDIRGKTRIQSSGNAELDIIDGSNFVRLAVNSVQGSFGTLSSQPLAFVTGALKRGEISTNGNFILQSGGTFVDAGQKLQVNGDTFLKGSGITSATLALFTQNNSGTTLFSVRNDCSTTYGGATVGIFPSSDRGISINSGAGAIFIGYYSGGDLGYRDIPSVTLGRPDNRLLNATVGVTIMTSIVGNYSPTSGTGQFTATEIIPIINQTGTATGTTRGLYINPTLTAAANWRSIEWSNNTGWGIYGTGTALNYLGGTLGIKTTSPYSPSTFSLDVNGGLLVKNTAGTTAQITLINADPSIGGNESFLVASVGGTSGGSYVDFQGYYGTSVVGSTALRLNPAGGAVIVNSTTNSGEQFQLTGTIRVNGQTSGSAGGNSGQHLIINCDGTSYKIALLNP